MAEIVVEGTVLTVTPHRHGQQTMVSVTVGEPVQLPIMGPADADREMAGIVVSVQQAIAQIPGLQQPLGVPRLTLTLTEQEYEELGRPRYPDRVRIAVTITSS